MVDQMGSSVDGETRMSIEIPGDTLISDDELAVEWGATRRTLSRYDRLPDGLPYVMIAGKKYRPINACREWLARRVTYPNPTGSPRRRKALARSDS